MVELNIGKLNSRHNEQHSIENTMSNNSGKNILHTLIFTAFLFTYTIMLPFMDRASSAASGILWAGMNDGTRVILHYLPNITRVIGFISFAFSRRLLPGTGSRKNLLVIISIFFVSSVIVITIGVSPVLTLISVFILAFTLGHLGGLMYYMMATYMSANPFSGRMTGGALSLSILIQFILQKATGETGAVATAVILWFILIYIAFRPPDDYILENPLPYADETDHWIRSVRRQMFIACIILLLITVISIRTDMAFISMQLNDTIDIYSYPRLFMIPGYLLLGFAADSKRKSTFNTLFFAGILLAFPIGLVASAESGFMALMSIYYFYASFYIFFLVFVFQRLAPKTTRPELWASAGRYIAEIYTLITSVIFVNLHIDSVENGIILTALVTTVLVALVYVAISAMGFEPSISPDSVENGDAEDEPSSAQEQPQDLDSFLSAYPLTPREKEIAVILLSTELTIKAIASDLGVSERSVFRYCASIYEKTGTGTRVGLMQAYMKGK